MFKRPDLPHTGKIMGFPARMHSVVLQALRWNPSARKEDFKNAIVDEGTITLIEFLLVTGAFALAMIDAWTKWFRT